jgi:lipopolysaccharide cholinephosphotransferase
MGSGSAKYISEIKIGRKGTLYCMPGTECLDISKQVQLDIFLVDHMRKRNIVCCLIQRILMIMKLNWDEKKLLIICVKKSHKKFKLFFIMALYILHLFRFIFTEEGIERIIYNMFIDNKNQSEYAGVIADSLLKSLWKKEATGSLVKIEYAGRMLYVPSGYDEILKNKYGNYMEFPPENKRYRNNFDEWIFRYE